MPTYEYVCEKCGHAFEEFQSIKADALKKCPACSKMGLQRLIGSGSGIIFKGSGFYATDYRSSTYQASKKSDKAESSAGSKAGTACEGCKNSECAGTGDKGPDKKKTA